ncbi:hypothetical protein AL755_06475 [Arthrobacter sp. ERGS1:01]|uniref:hypothetical protein n=1 Tax=Arthrobacter sp. ERGS1:01 TaxID=1704044 RepID=UPI0006B41238|nr:hypothetical protein [Arthrobacter sp. ERGS1:01]ALE05208.1 hypothetical protein AL755_06475 [Arthrobacter sp. ERGS1:01]
MLPEMLDYMSTRELSMSIWTLILLLVLLLWPATRASIKDAVRSMLHWKVSLSFALYTTYLASAVWLMWSLHLWDQELLGGTVIWLLGSGFILLGNAVTEAPKQHHFFKGAVLDSLRVVAVVEFAVAARPFAIGTELWLVPALAVLTVFWAVSTTADNASGGSKFWVVIAAMVGLTLIVLSVRDLILHPANDVFDDVRAFFLPILLGLAAIPAAFIAAVIGAYELFATRLSRYPTGHSLPPKVVLGLVASLNWDLFAIDRFPGQCGYAAARLGTFADARSLVAQYRNDERAREDRRAAAKRRLEELADVQGTDESGRQLDRREFEETKRALEWLQICLTSRHHNTGRFQADILEVMGSFQTQGLPDPHGICVRVRKDGQAWFGYRETPSGYYFGIGANGAGPSQWVYSMEVPPAGYPSSRSQGWTNSLVADTPLEWLPETMD